MRNQIDEGNDSGISSSITGDSSLDALIVALDAAVIFNADVRTAIENITESVMVGMAQITLQRDQSLAQIVSARNEAIAAINAAKGDPLYRPSGGNPQPWVNSSDYYRGR